jgi:hypothetical protein
MAAFRHLRSTLPAQKIIETVRRKDVIAATRLVTTGRFADGLKDPFTKIAEVYRKSAERGALKITRQLRHVRSRKSFDEWSRLQKAPGGSFAFDLTTPEVQQQLADYQDALITGLTDDVQAVVYQTILDGVQAGESPEAIADDLKLVIGLTDRQAQAVDNFANMLESGDAEAMNRALMSSADAQVMQDVLDAGGTLEQDQIDAMVFNYAEAQLAFRADQIATTEATRAAELGLYDAYGQAVDRGVFPDGAVTRVWKLDLDERTCDICLSIVDNNPDGVGQDEPFDSDDGPIDYPPVHPNCRCSVDYVTDLDQMDAGDNSEEG